ncbi:hypothetical protein [Phenylobacterium sp.]|uniref:hypothetical protein n=1 Tax=Phenylobacterium sp. TaxID=1871053 RepID=UPI001214A30F|nr:hypothetical protein [Phenylobacterium sp.]TAL29950.1 MAG: hypothetical protein EPN98_19385 [Phenylobacterium sp.]
MVALLLAALFQSAAPAATVAATPAAPPAKAARLACRKETVVGSTIKKKICPRKVEVAAQGDSPEAAEMAQDK